MAKKILFLTSNNLATNPRLLKEVKLALSIGYSVKILSFLLGNWSDQKSDAILDELENSYTHFKKDSDTIFIDATVKNKSQWLLWGIVENLSLKLYPLFSKNILINALASSKRSIQILREVKKIKNFKPNFIVAHNLATLYPAHIISKNHQLPYVFDVEDFHPGELIKTDASNEKNRREFLMKSLLPNAYAVTFASELIQEYTLNLIGEISKTELVLNGFSKEEFFKQNMIKPTTSEHVLKLVWFSQTISFGRGLEQFFESLLSLDVKTLTNKIEITLIGDLNQKFYVEVLQPFIQKVNKELIDVLIIKPLSQKELHNKLEDYDVGLALEFDSTDLNRQLCLTNKILAYAQSGLYIIATKTKAQKLFLETFPSLGVLVNQNSKNIAEELLKIIKDKKILQANRESRRKVSETFSWENESHKIAGLWKNINRPI